MKMLFLSSFAAVGLAVLLVLAEPAPASNPVTPDAVQIESESFSGGNRPLGTRNQFGNGGQHDRYGLIRRG